MNTAKRVQISGYIMIALEKILIDWFRYWGTGKNRKIVGLHCSGSVISGFHVAELMAGSEDVEGMVYSGNLSGMGYLLDVQTPKLRGKS